MEKIDFKELAGIVLIPASADGVEGYFAFDTGAMQTALNRGYFPDLTGGDMEVAIFDNGMASSGASKAALHSLDLGGVSVRDVDVLLMDMTYVERSLRTLEPDVRFLGSVGPEVFGGAPVLLDYASSTLTLSPEPCVEGAEAIPLSAEALPVVTVSIAGKPRRFVLDTGANTCLISSELSAVIPSSPSQDSPGLSVVAEMGVGERKYRDVTVLFTDISQIRSRVDVDGVIGYQILSPQPSLIDLKNSALYLF